MADTLEAALAGIVDAAVSRAVTPLLRELRDLRAAVTAAGARWCSRRETAETLGISTDTVDRMIRDGRLRSRRIGARVTVMLEPPAGDDAIAALAQEARS